MSHIRIDLSREPVAAYCPTVFASAARLADICARQSDPSDEFTYTSKNQKLVTHGNPAELSNRRVSSDRRKDGRLDNVLMSSQLGLGVALLRIPYPCSLDSRANRQPAVQGTGVEAVAART